MGWAGSPRRPPSLQGGVCGQGEEQHPDPVQRDFPGEVRSLQVSRRQRGEAWGWLKEGWPAASGETIALGVGLTADSVRGRRFTLFISWKFPWPPQESPWLSHACVAAAMEWGLGPVMTCEWL